MAVDTKLAILDAAEELFAESGIAAVSLRKIIGEAHVNLAAVHYHFGSKDDLVKAVFQRRLEQVNDERIRSLEELREASGGKPIELKALLEAFLKAPLSLGQTKGGGGRNFFRLVARAHAETNQVVNQTLFECLREVVYEFLSEIQRSVPELDRRESAVRLAFTAGAMVQAILMPLKEHFEGELLQESLPDEDVLDMLVRFCTGGFASEGGGG